MIEDSGWLYLELEDLERIREYWKLPPVARQDNLESALARPRQAFGDPEPFPDAASKAAALGWGLARGHGLADGNKRLGAVATLLFLHVNGFDAAFTGPELVALFEACAAHTLDEDEVRLFIHARIAAAPQMDPVLSDDELTAELQPHLDAVILFAQQAATERSVEVADFQMVMEDLRALVAICVQLSDGPPIPAVLSVVERFLGLIKNFRFAAEP